MDTSKALPRPWNVEPLQWDHGASLAICAQGGIVAEIGPDPDLQVVDEPNMDTVVRYPWDEANAALIVRAVNAHDYLVAALRAADYKLFTRKGHSGSPLSRQIQTAIDMAEGEE